MKCGREWRAIVRNRANGKGCKDCADNVTPEYNLGVLFPELADEWHPTLNGDLTPDKVFPQSGQHAWWRCSKCEREWRAKIASKTHNGNGCSRCKNLIPSKDHNLGVKHPELIKEWHPTLNGDLTPYDVTPKSGKSVWWRCKRGHEWEAEIKSRANGASCKTCNPKTSQMEILIYCELKSIFQNVRWREKVNGQECDVFIPDYNIAVEYDGVYYHQERHEQDIIKNQKLSGAGVTLFRVRQAGLAPLSKKRHHRRSKRRQILYHVKITTQSAKP